MTDMFWADGLEFSPNPNWETLGSLTVSGDHARTGAMGLGRNGSGSSYRAEVKFSAPIADVVCGFAFRWQDTTALTSDLLFWEIRLQNLAPVYALALTPQKTLSLWHNPISLAAYNPNADRRAFSTFSLDEGAWYYIEIYAHVETTRYDMVVQVNGPPGANGTTGAEVLSHTGGNLSPLQFRRTRMGILESGGGNKNISFDDLYMGVGTDYLGSARVHLLTPVADRAVALTPLSGSDNYAMVNEVTADDGTTYNSTGVSGDEDVFDVDPLGLTGRIVSLATAVRWVDTTAGGWTLSPLLQVAGDTDVGAAEANLGAYLTNFKVFLTQPNTDPWDSAAVDLVGIGYRAEEVVS